MSLDNLVGISLEKIEPDKITIAKLISTAGRNLADTKIEGLSDGLCFDAAYKSIMQLANAALQAHGYRTLTSKPGHHMTMIQSLGQTIGLDKQIIIVLDKMRKQRNVIDYSGDIVPESMVRECVGYAEQLFIEVKTWLNENKPELLDE